jgi:RHS repeat-associated protein
VVAGAGHAAATYAYDPYGTLTTSTGTGALADANPYRHTTGLHDPATGLVKHGTRWNDTTTGRWTTTDPITRLTDPNQANPYQYASSCPVNFVDPTGKSPCGEAIAGLALAAAGFFGGTALLVATPISGGWTGVGTVLLYEVAAASLPLSISGFVGSC